MTSTVIPWLNSQIADLTRERDELRVSVEQFRADLGIYGDHLDSCLLRQENVAVVGRSRCNCGYFEAVGRGLVVRGDQT